jgi:hypothetical protein
MKFLFFLFFKIYIVKLNYDTAFALSLTHPKGKGGYSLQGGARDVHRSY